MMWLYFKRVYSCTYVFEVELKDLDDDETLLVLEWIRTLSSDENG